MSCQTPQTPPAMDASRSRVAVERVALHAGSASIIASTSGIIHAGFLCGGKSGDNFIVCSFLDLALPNRVDDYREDRAKRRHNGDNGGPRHYCLAGVSAG